MRVTGMVSGMDTDTMVQDLMRVERMRVDRFTQKRQINLWRQDAYQTINRKMANFILNSQKNMGLKATGSTGTLVNKSYKNLEYLKKVESSNTDYADVKIRGKAANGSFNIKIDKLAESASYTSDKIGVSEKFSGEITVGGVVVHGEKDGEISVNDLVKKINNNKDLKERNVSAFYEKKTGSIFIQGDTGEDDLSLKVGKRITRENIKGEENIIDYVNKLGIDGVNISSIDELDDELTNKIEEKTGKKFNLDNGKKPGEEGEEIEPNYSLSVEEDLGQLGFIENKKGSYGSAEINGVKFDKLTNNKLEFNGVEISLKKPTKIGNDQHAEVNITVDTNYEGVIEKINGIVNEYNSMLDEIASVLNEEVYKSYHPLSDDEKKALSDDDAKAWQEKAKSGMLNNDETLNRMMDRMRLDLYKNVEGLEGSFKHITEIGITTQKYSRGSTGGKLQVDEENLYKALEEDTEGVMELLFGKGEVEGELSSGSTDKGIFTGIYDNMVTGMKDIIDKSGPGEDSDLLRDVRSNILIDFVSYKGSISDIDKDNRSVEKKIQDLEQMLIRKEDAYYAQFATMEKYMSQMYSQSSWLAQQTMMY